MAKVEGMTDRYRWVILCVLWITYIVVFLHRFSVGPLAPFFKDDLGLNSTQVGLVMSAASLGYMISILPIGWVVDRVGARWPMVTGEWIAGFCMIALFFVKSYIGLLILMFIGGLGCGFLFPSTTQGVISWFSHRERATVMGLKQTAVNIGGIISAATLPAIALSLGWRYCFLFFGILSLIIGGTAFALYREPRMGSCSQTNFTPPIKVVSLLEILKSREIWLFAFSGLCLAWVEMALIAHLVLYLTEEVFLGVVVAGGFLAIAQFAGAITKPGSGLLSDRVFGGNRKLVYMLMAGMTSIMCLMLSLFGSCLSWALYPVIFILGVGSLGYGGIHLTLISEFAGRYGIGKAIGLGGLITLIGSSIGPTFFGYIVDRSGSYKNGHGYRCHLWEHSVYCFLSS